MPKFPVFLSLVVTVRNQATELERILSKVTDTVKDLVSDYELIVVDNASEDASISQLKALVGKGGIPNVQMFALTKKVDVDTASWVGLENALGDFVVVIDPMADDIGFLEQMLDKAVSGCDVVLAKNKRSAPQGLAYRIGHRLFNTLYRWFNGVDLAKDAPHYRVLSKTVVNFILQHPQPEITYRHIPATGGFAKANLEYEFYPELARKKRFRGSLDRGMRLIISSSRAPMRAVTTLSLMGAIANLLYSIYIVAIWLFKSDVAPGWASLSLQQSGMFFMISLVLLVFGEYMLHTASLSTDGPLYHIGQEVTSTEITRREKLNIEETTKTEAKESNS